MGFHHVGQAGLELLIHVPQLPKVLGLQVRATVVGLILVIFYSNVKLIFKNCILEKNMLLKLNHEEMF